MLLPAWNTPALRFRQQLVASARLWMGTVCATAFLLAGAAWLVHRHQNARLHEARQMQAPKLDGGLSSPQAASASVADYTRRLPERPVVDAWVRDIVRAASTSAVTVLSVDAASRALSADALARIDTTLVLRGRYDAIKAVLSQGLDRSPNVVLKELQIKRTSALEDLEATVSVMVLGRPADPASR